MTRSLYLISCLGVAMLTMGVDSCGDSHEAGVCTVNGVSYANGDRGVPAGDGCNTCSCENGSLTGCTEIACPPGGGACVVDGVAYADGATGIPAPDGCNTCVCTEGGLACTDLACPPTGGSCVVDGVTYADGASDVPAPDGCNTCTCDNGLVTSCTEIGCPPGGPACSVFGESYNDWAPSPDGCNTCGCDNGQVNNVCTELACGPIPIQPCDELSTFMSHPYELGPVTITGDTLSAQVSFSGGCAPHFFRLCYDRAFLESNPVQVEVRLDHDSQFDPCEAYPTETREFDLTALRQEYERAYMATSGTMILRMGGGVTYTF